LAALKNEGRAKEIYNKKRRKLEISRKSRVVRHVTVVRCETKSVPVRIVRDEFEEDRLQVGNDLVGWPAESCVYPGSIEITEIELSDGRVLRSSAASLLYIEKRFVEVLSVSRKTTVLEEGYTDARKIFIFGRFVGYRIHGSAYPSEVESVTIGTVHGLCKVARQDVSCVYHGETVELFRTRQQKSWMKAGAVDWEMFSGMEVGDQILAEEALNAYPRTDHGIGRDAMMAMRTGDLFSSETEYAFWKRRDGSVTNGKIVFPKERPSGLEWRQHKDIGFACKVSAGNWPTLLDAIVGCYFESVNTDEGVRARIVREKAIVRNRERIRNVVAGQCFDPGTFDESEDVEVGIGERLLFIGKREGKRVYVVDSPNHGHALYVFGEEDIEAARDWANGRSDWQKARDLAKSRIVHVGEWQERALAAIN